MIWQNSSIDRCYTVSVSLLMWNSFVSVKSIKLFFIVILFTAYSIRFHKFMSKLNTIIFWFWMRSLSNQMIQSKNFTRFEFCSCLILHNHIELKQVRSLKCCYIDTIFQKRNAILCWTSGRRQFLILYINDISSLSNLILTSSFLKFMSV